MFLGVKWGCELFAAPTGSAGVPLGEAPLRGVGRTMGLPLGVKGWEPLPLPPLPLLLLLPLPLLLLLLFPLVGLVVMVMVRCAGDWWGVWWREEEGGMTMMSGGGEGRALCEGVPAPGAMRDAGC